MDRQKNTEIYLLDWVCDQSSLYIYIGIRSKIIITLLSSSDYYIRWRIRYITISVFGAVNSFTSRCIRIKVILSDKSDSTSEYEFISFPFRKGFIPKLPTKSPIIFI